MIDASMLLHMISALDTLEKMFQGKRVGNTRRKSENGSLSKKPAGPNTGPRRRAGTGEWGCEREVVSPSLLRYAFWSKRHHDRDSGLERFPTF